MKLEIVQTQADLFGNQVKHTWYCDESQSQIVEFKDGSILALGEGEYWVEEALNA